MDITRIETGPRFAQAVVANGFVFLAGQVAGDPARDVADQTWQILARIDELLAQAGTDRRSLVSVTIFLSDMADFGAMNEVWDRWVDPQAKPARATVEARLAMPAFRVEIQATACTRSGGSPGH